MPEIGEGGGVKNAGKSKKEEIRLLLLY